MRRRSSAFKSQARPSLPSARSGSQSCTQSQEERPMIMPLPLSAILGLPLRPFLTTLPQFPELVAGLGKAPTNGRLASSNNCRNLRRRKPFQISEHQNRAIRDRHLCQDILYLLGQLGLDSRVRIGKLERNLAITIGPINRCWWGGLAAAAAQPVQPKVHGHSKKPRTKPPCGVEAFQPAIHAPESFLGQISSKLRVADQPG